MSSAPPSGRVSQTRQRSRQLSISGKGPCDNLGLVNDDKLGYIEDTPIHNDYKNYKHKHGAEMKASKLYKDTAAPLVATKPYLDPRPSKAGNKMYNVGGHIILAPLAESAEKAARHHADSRESFNSDYRYILLAKKELEGHEKQAEQARRSQQSWEKYAKEHSDRLPSNIKQQIAENLRQSKKEVAAIVATSIQDLDAPRHKSKQEIEHIVNNTKQRVDNVLKGSNQQLKGSLLGL